jgi:hypothetical protein
MQRQNAAPVPAAPAGKFHIFTVASNMAARFPQLDLKRLASLVWREHDGVTRPRNVSVASDRLSGSGSAFASSVTFDEVSGGVFLL